MLGDLSRIDKDYLLKLYHEFNSSRIDYNTRKWETVKFFTSAHTALITATVAIATFMIEYGSIDTHTKLLLSILPISAIIIAILGYESLKRESKLLFEQEASMFKIEKYLGLHNEISEDKRWLPADPYLVPPKHRDIFYRTRCLINKDRKSITFEEWLNDRMRGHKFLGIMGVVFLVELGIALALVVIIILFL